MKESLKALGSILQLFPPNQTYEEEFGTDAELLESDWKIIGDELRKAMGKAEDEYSKRSS